MCATPNVGSEQSENDFHNNPFQRHAAIVEASARTPQQQYLQHIERRRIDEGTTDFKLSIEWLLL